MLLEESYGATSVFAEFVLQYFRLALPCMGIVIGIVKRTRYAIDFIKHHDLAKKSTGSSDA